MTNACDPRRGSEEISCLSLPMVTPSMKSKTHTRGVMARPGKEKRFRRRRNPAMNPASMQVMMMSMVRMWCYCFSAPFLFSYFLQNRMNDMRPSATKGTPTKAA